MLVLTSKDDPETLNPGTHIFKVRLINSDGKPLGFGRVLTTLAPRQSSVSR